MEGARLALGFPGSNPPPTENTYLVDENGNFIVDENGNNIVALGVNDNG